MVSHIEDVICELAGIAEREELPIDLFELYDYAPPSGRVMPEPKQCFLGIRPRY